MLQALHIENIAVIERADLDFEAGMTVLTGETGAGKSIVIDAVGAVLGARTSRELVRTGASSALASAVFSASAAAAWCGDNGIEPEDGLLYIIRRISADGKNICRVNGCPVSVAQLRELGNQLMNIHGQNDGQQLLDERTHLRYLDSFADDGEIQAAYDVAYADYVALMKEKQDLSISESERARRVDTLQFQIAELEKAKLKPGELEEITARCNLLKNAGKLTDAVHEALVALDGNDDGCALTQIGNAEGALRTAARWAPELEDLCARLTQLRYDVQDVAETIRDFANQLDFSPEEYDELETRISALRRIVRKYGGDESAALDYLAKCKMELDAIDSSAARLELVEAELKKKYSIVQAAAQKLTDARTLAAQRLEKRLMQELEQLAMSSVQFKVCLTPLAEPTKTGMDDVRFLMSANAGEELGRISRIASGGELSRIMLAMKNVLSEHDAVDTMVFDEVDTGVSGIAAQRVAEKLASLAKSKQVICVTHLPQIAAMADHHFLIEKTEMGGRTYTNISLLDYEQRKKEIARLTSGDHVTDATLTAADEQLQAAKRYRESARSITCMSN
jgi:DNA repair protein RecN (Recombination protein N)